MAEQGEVADACKAIGLFTCLFSELKYELGETVKVIFRVNDHGAADAIVTLADFTKKVNLVKSAMDLRASRAARSFLKNG